MILTGFTSTINRISTHSYLKRLIQQALPTVCALRRLASWLIKIAREYAWL
jgi:hypothetical protein